MLAVSEKLHFTFTIFLMDRTAYVVFYTVKGTKVVSYKDRLIDYTGYIDAGVK